MLFSAILGSVSGLLGISIFFMVRIEKITGKVKSKIDGKRKLEELTDTSKILRFDSSDHEKDSCTNSTKISNKVHPQKIQFSEEVFDVHTF